MSILLWRKIIDFFYNWIEHFEKKWVPSSKHFPARYLQLAKWIVENGAC